MERSGIVVVGSSNTDMIVRVPRLPRPGETVLGEDFVIAGGGKGANQAVAARRLGAPVTFVVRLGQDIFGEQSLSRFTAEGIDTGYVVRDPDAPSGVALIYVGEDGENMIAVASGANARLGLDDVRRAAPAIARSQVLVAQLEIPLPTVREALTLARAAGARTILNPAPAPRAPLPDDLYPLIDVLNPNRSEAELLSGVAVSDLATAGQAGHALLRRGVGAVVITLGGQGALVVSPAGSQPIPAYPVRAIDTVGAGDAFTAGLAVALAQGASRTDAARYASAVAALATTKPGAQPSLPTEEEVRAFLKNAR